MKREKKHAINGALCLAIALVLAALYRDEGEWAPLFVWPLLVQSPLQLGYGLWLRRYRPTPEREFGRSDSASFLAILAYVAGSDGPLDDRRAGSIYDLVHDTTGKHASWRALRKRYRATRRPLYDVLLFPKGLTARETDMALLLASIVALQQRHRLRAAIRVATVAQGLGRDWEAAVNGMATAFPRWTEWRARETSRLGPLPHRWLPLS